MRTLQLVCMICLFLVQHVTAHTAEIFTPKEEFQLLAQSYDDGLTDPEPLRLFMERCQRFNPELITWNNLFFSLANLYFSNNQWSRALEYYEKAQSGPESMKSGLYYRMGLCASHLNQHKGAILHYQMALKHCSMDQLKHKILFAQATSYEALADYTKQDKVFDQIIKRTRRGTFRRKIDLLRSERAVKRNRIDTAFARLITLISHRTVDTYSIEAIRLLETITAKFGWQRVYDHDLRLKTVLHFYYRSGEFSRALPLAQRHLKRFPNSKNRSFVNGILGHCYYRLNKFQEAITHYQLKLKTIRSSSDRAYYLRKIALCHQKRGSYEIAVPLYQEIVQKYSRYKQSSYALLSLAYCFELKGDSQTALQYYRQLETKRAQPYLQEEALFRQAMIHYVKGNYPASLTFINQLQTRKKLVSREEDSIFWQAKLLQLQHKEKEALVVYEKFLQNFPGSVYSDLIMTKLDQSGQSGSQKRQTEQHPEQKTKYAQLISGRIYPNLPLILSGQRAFSQPPGIPQKSSRVLHLAQLFRFHFDYELALDNFIEYQRYNYKDISLLLTLIHFHYQQQHFRKALYYADAIRSLFKDGVDWQQIPPHVKRFFFPLLYPQILHREAARNSLDKRLLAAVIHQESRFDHNAVSAAGARGLMQIMPETGAEIARDLHSQEFSVHLLGPAQFNIRFGSYYLKKLVAYYQSEIPWSLAAYNAGVKHVDDWKSLQTTLLPTSDYSEIIAAIRFRETRNYVKKIMVNLRHYQALYDE
ncbi:transglycosylase SLT domain-containing protein [candidate division CSSED10-310 bacterium]|uniref:Transglycosylase SLT domain-containing protein n=1 Tax=candidate division CSSED10-310 bacterium TaxID=2855610 RepID=A0ABV6YUD4_UNCC1